ncbi:MAG: hypothetical protein AB1Z19_04895 [Eubacteriales bacterium]
MLENETGYENDFKEPSVRSPKKDLVGLGGWLIIFQIRILLAFS